MRIAIATKPRSHPKHRTMYTYDIYHSFFQSLMHVCICVWVWYMCDKCISKIASQIRCTRPMRGFATTIASYVRVHTRRCLNICSYIGSIYVSILITRTHNLKTLIAVSSTIYIEIKIPTLYRFDD